mgnify:CR=1 FL=1
MAPGKEFRFTPGDTDAARHSMIWDETGALGGGMLVPADADGRAAVLLQSDLCRHVASWGVARCPVSAAQTHRMLVVESMDADAEAGICAAFKAYFGAFATMYCCPYCRHHLNAYVIQSKEPWAYPIEYTLLGWRAASSADEDFARGSRADTLATVARADERRVGTECRSGSAPHQ